MMILLYESTSTSVVFIHKLISEKKYFLDFVKEKKNDYSINIFFSVSIQLRQLIFTFYA